MNEVQQAIRHWLKDLVKETVTEAIREAVPQIIKDCADLLDPESKLYTKKEVCEKLGISPATFHNWVNTGKLTETKLGNKAYVDAALLDRALEQGIIRKGSQRRFSIDPDKYNVL